MSSPAGQQNYPHRWSLIAEILSAQRSTSELGLSCPPGTLHRFGARYRMAKSFEGLSLSDGYAPATVDGYTALFRAFLMYSTLEQLARVKGAKKVWKLEIEYDRFDNSAYVAEVKDCAQYLNFLNFLIDNIDERALREAVQVFYSDRPGALMIHIAAAIRHIFAHGIFSANSGTTDSNATLIRICDLAFAFTLDVVNGVYADTFDEVLDEVERLNEEWLAEQFAG